RQRGTGLGSQNDEREQTLNQLLTEMDGFENNDGVIVMAATNRADVLDPALLRPGRFDRQIAVGYPDIKGREEILKVHARNKSLEPDVDLNVIAKGTVGFTGADLENVLNEAALLAAREKRTSISMKNIEDAIIKVIVGPEKKSRKISERENKLTAFHEAGHAITSHVLPTQDPVHMISIIPTGRAGGYTLNLPVEDKSYASKKEMMEKIIVLLGGRAAEALMLDDISTGASNDIQRATGIARDMVTKYGMSDRLGPMMFGNDNDEVFIGRDFGHTRNYSENVAAQIDDEIKIIIDNCYQKALEILKENNEKLIAVAEKLIQYEKLLEDEFEVIIKGEEDFDLYMTAKKEKEEAEKAERERIAKEKEAAEKAEQERKEKEAEEKKKQMAETFGLYAPQIPDEKDKKDE
ncbi:MAG: AAA family ATPase, partial [Clostridia bacterium]|nr:AAA family ATPase [Clostridia bacterium]